MITTFWAKTVDGDLPGISVRGHCVNVGCVAQALHDSLANTARALFPPGLILLAALHDVGKISCGFQCKCPPWLVQNGLADIALRERWGEHLQVENDHAKISQWFLQRILNGSRLQRWAVAAGVHHGRIFGQRINQLLVVPAREQWLMDAREELVKHLAEIFGPLPSQTPATNDADLWCVAGLISVADWIGSNDAFFPSDRELSLDESRRRAEAALEQIGWGRAKLREASFERLFNNYKPKPLQRKLHESCAQPGLFIVEGPMGCGKTEAALWAAHRLITAGANDGIYFALPTQVTSNRIHLRVADFLDAALAGQSTLRLAHGASWLEDCQTLELHPAAARDAQAEQSVREGRSWFASGKHALLARFGVGTIDQALQGVVAVKHFFVRRFGLAGKVVILDEIHSYDVYTGTLITQLIKELLALHCSVIVLSATLTQARREELIKAASGQAGNAASPAYPMLTVVKAGEPVREISVPAGAARRLNLKTAAFSPAELCDECLQRAEAGQHVLYLRNTVIEAQEAFKVFTSEARADRIITGLLHSRFPYFRRQELEDFWLARLGVDRAPEGKGSILVATQVVEQSVDIDLDFIVSDLAPTDMLLQRMGRLWRHARPDRRASEPEFWINLPLLAADARLPEIKRALGKSGRVYAPYVLLRTAEVFAGRDTLILPDEIRAVLEATYAERSRAQEPEAWQELRAALEKDRETQALLAESAMKIFGQQSQEDAEGLLTRCRGAPTRNVVLLRSCEPVDRHSWRVTPLKGDSFMVSDRRWDLEAARCLYRQLVRAPMHQVPMQAAPAWLSLHVREEANWALVQDNGACLFPGAGDSVLAYESSLGLYSTHSKAPLARPYEDDDEFDY